MRRTGIYFFLIVVLMQCVRCSTTASHPAESESSPNSSVPPTEVDVVVARVKPFEYFIPTSGKILAANEVRVQFRRSGMLQSLSVTNGTTVRKGDVIAVLDHEKQKLSLSRAQTAVDEKMIAYDDIMLGYRNMKDTVGFGSISRNVRTSSGLRTSEIMLEEARLEYANSFVRAPISGVVSGCDVSPGTVVSESTFLCFIHDEASMLIHVEVLESDALHLKKGTIAEVRPTALPDKVFGAKIESINPRVESKTGMVKVVLRMDGHPKVLPGMNAKVTMILQYDSKLIVPKEAILIRAGKTVAFTAERKLAKWKYVTVGRENGKEVEILSGINEGDSVIVANNLQLAHDATIKVKSN